MKKYRLLVALLSGSYCVPLVVFAASPDFDRDIRPILSDKCYFCHGPDAERREAGLRLDTRAGALDAAVVPGDPDSSEMIARIMSDDESTRMPPADSGLTLSTEEKQALKEWIAAGAEYAEHWAFRRLPATVDVPTQADSEWPRNEIDQFVLARLRSEQLAPTAQADPLRLLRRLSLDLTGLPPSLREIETFERAAAADVDAALDAAVDRLLASQAFGEHLAVGWLDAARYADSFGYQSDQLNTQWPYRDWVVNAFNEGLPYDQFLTWQLAGDLLESPSEDQRVATAFNRLHRMTNEGGSIAEEWLAENAADRVHTFGSAMLGLTLECARCHDHKFDPILTRDYYAISAFFNSIDENGMYDHAAKVPSPSMLLPTPEQKRRLKEARSNVESAERRLTKVIEQGSDRFEAWMESKAGKDATAHLAPLKATPNGGGLLPVAAIPDLAAHFTFDGAGQSLVSEAPPAEAQGAADGLSRTAGHRGEAIRCDGDHGATFPELMEVDRTDPFTIALWLRDAERSSQPVVIAHRSYGTDVGYNGFDVMLQKGFLEARIYRVWPGNGIGVRALESLPADQWQHVVISYDGSSRAGGLRIYLDGREAPTKVLRDKIQKRASVPTHGSGVFTLGQRFRDRGFRGGAFDELRIYTRSLTPLEVSSIYAESALPADSAGRTTAVPVPPFPRDALRQTYFSAYDEPARLAVAELQAAWRELVTAEEEVHEISIMEELESPRPTFVLARGAYDAPKNDDTRVARDVFSEILPRFPAGQPRNRLGLARWLTSADHPLTARVFVNRMWANFFGRGLTGTLDDFGRQGALPSHPQLLDWLARDFVDHGWDVKRLCRQIVDSAAYRQDSRATLQLRRRDPDNLLLARGPSRRLSAEQIRDLALNSSGLLVDARGGPPVYPYQPGEDLWREANGMSPPYKQSSGDSLRRRSLYSVWKRTAPLPNMTAFDAPSREVCTIERGRTNTPLQALILLNDVQFVEASRALAADALRQHDDVDSRLAEAFLRLTGRLSDSRESSVLRELYDEQLAIFADHPDEAASLLRVGEAPLDQSLPTGELAAMTVVCQAILSLDATIYER